MPKRFRDISFNIVETLAWTPLVKASIINSRTTQVRTFCATHIAFITIITASQLYFLANKNAHLAVRSQETA